MSPRSALAMFAYGTLAAAVLACLWLVSLAPLRLNWGRELVGAVIAIVALVVGVHLSRRRDASAHPDTARTRATDPPDAAQDRITSDADVPPLSGRELQVLRLLARGLSNKQLARELSVSENTVKTHLANTYAKLGVGRRTEALALAHRRGWIPPG